MEGAEKKKIAKQGAGQKKVPKDLGQKKVPKDLGKVAVESLDKGVGVAAAFQRSITSSSMITSILFQVECSRDLLVELDAQRYAGMVTGVVHRSNELRAATKEIKYAAL